MKKSSITKNSKKLSPRDKSIAKSLANQEKTKKVMDFSKNEVNKQLVAAGKKPAYTLGSNFEKQTKELEKLQGIYSQIDTAYKQLYKKLAAEYPGTPLVTAYILVDMIENKLNALKALEYHYRDHGKNGRDKKKYPEELTVAQSAIKLFGENWERGNPYSRLVLQEKHDPSGTVNQRNKIKKRP